MTDIQDYISHLPMEVSSYILSFLHLKSLLACCAVNEVWYEITNDVRSETWFKACLKVGIYVRKDKYKEAKDWKAFAFSTLDRVRDIQDTSVTSYEFDEPVRTISCHGEKVAVAFSDRIQIWNLPDSQSIGEFGCKFEPLYVKLDDTIIIAASRSGALSCWSLTLGNHLWYLSYDNCILTDFDFLTGHDIVVGSFFENDIRPYICRIWNSASREVHEIIGPDLSRIEKVMLVPDPDHPVSEQEDMCYLFCLSTCCVKRSRVKLLNGLITTQFEGLIIIPSEGSFIPDPLLRTQRVLSDKSPAGLQFDGETLYILTATPLACSRNIWTYNWKTNSSTCIENRCPIIRFLGVREKCLAYQIRQEDDRELVIAVDKITKETISQFTVPRRTHLNRDDYLCLGNISWLDSINGESNSGAVYVSITDDRLGVYVRRFVPPSE